MATGMTTSGRTDIFEVLDVEGEPLQAWPPVAAPMQRLGAVVVLRHPHGPASEETLRALDNKSAARLAAFLLNAAKVDIVGAARRMIEAQQRYGITAGPEYSWDEHERSATRWREAAETVASELAKLDAMVRHDMSEATREK